MVLPVMGRHLWQAAFGGAGSESPVESLTPTPTSSTEVSSLFALLSCECNGDVPRPGGPPSHGVCSKGDPPKPTALKLGGDSSNLGHTEGLEL